MRPIRTFCAVVCLGFAAKDPAAALELTLTDTYNLNAPASLDYDPTFCGLWIANEGPEAILVTLDGLELRRVRSDLPRIKAISVDGDNLIVGDGMGALQRLTKDGETLGAPFPIEGGWADTEGIVVTPDGSLITVADDPEYMSWLSPDGKILRRENTRAMTPPLTEAQGIAQDPRTGHLLIVDDYEGSNSLYEYDADGDFLASLSLYEFGLDPEGIAIRPGSGQVFIAFQGSGTVAAFDYVPTQPKQTNALPPGGDCMMF